ncbi:hypothetical protein UPYG_G00191350 [Umbra pygmaea]|uniref:trypsin n=1 Tax=Umbra pygmaea TaxID=75934 RepID=A0ABD0XFM7_UMBPY
MAYFGAHSLKTIRKDAISEEIKKNVPHPEFNDETFENDIMLLQLKTPVNVSRTVSINPVPNPVADMRAGTRCFVAGWGATAEKGGRSDVLQVINLKVIDRRVCNSLESYNGRITNGMLCAGSTNKQEIDACEGHGGGPLVCDGLLRGVVSWGRGCGNFKYPGVYTFISKYDKWIRETIKTSK